MAITAYQSAALEAGNVSTTDSFNEIFCTNTSAGVLYFQIFFDVTALPADTAVPDVCIAVPATGTVSWDPAGDYRRVGAGVAFCLSSTAATKTIAGAWGAFHII